LSKDFLKIFGVEYDLARSRHWRKLKHASHRELIHFIAVYILMANDFELRLKRLEDREVILYGYIDELRANSVKLDRQHDEMLKRIEQNEWMIASLVETTRSMIETQGRIIQTQDTLVETQGMILKLMDRMDQKLDNLSKPGKNGHS
jgi:hypothetical protein